jgi:hypothetical protein
LRHSSEKDARKKTDSVKAIVSFDVALNNASPGGT